MFLKDGLCSNGCVCVMGSNDWEEASVNFQAAVSDVITRRAAYTVHTYALALGAGRELPENRNISSECLLQKLVKCLSVLNPAKRLY